jgi:hypothetical protein
VVNTSAHWYVAIICNLDQAKPRKDGLKPPRTRSQIDRSSPETLDVDDDFLHTSNELQSHPSTPRMAVDPDGDIIEISILEEPSRVNDVDEPSHNEMDDDFRRLSISSEAPLSNEVSYNYKNDPQMDNETRREIERLRREDMLVKETRRTRIRDEDAITLDDLNELDSITSGLKQKYASNPTKPSTTKASTTVRRTSNRIVPLDSYVPPYL